MKTFPAFVLLDVKGRQISWLPSEALGYSLGWRRLSPMAQETGREESLPSAIQLKKKFHRSPLVVVSTEEE